MLRLENMKVTQAITPTAGAAGTTTINGTTLDMQDWEGVAVIVTFGAITAGGVQSVKGQQGAASNMSDAADLAASSSSVADTDDEKVVVKVFRNVRERYFRVVVPRATQNAVVASAEYIQFGKRRQPNTGHGATVLAATEHVSPAEGAA